MNQLSDRVTFATARRIYSIYEYFSGRSVQLADGDLELRVVYLISYTEKRLENDCSRLEGLKKGQQWNDQLAGELAALYRKKQVVQDICVRNSCGIGPRPNNLEGSLGLRKAEFLLWKEFFSAPEHFLAVLLGISQYKNKLTTAMLRIGFLPTIYVAFSALSELSTLASLIGAWALAYYVSSCCVKFIRIFSESQTF